MTTPTLPAAVEHITREGRRTVDYYTLTIDGTTLATAHCVGIPDDTWSVVRGGKFVALAKGRNVAVRALEKMAEAVATA